jgi:hypothetical protein
MISKFLGSKFSGYIALAGIISILGLVWYIYNEGKSACVNEVKSAQLDSTVEVQRDTQAVKKTEQQLDTPMIDKGLCDLGIARGGVGCE